MSSLNLHSPLGVVIAGPPLCQASEALLPVEVILPALAVVVLEAPVIHGAPPANQLFSLTD